MKTKQLIYTQDELDWYEKRIADIRSFIDENSPLSEIENETDITPNAKGVPIITIISKASEKIKLIMSMMKEVPKMIQDLEDLRSAKAAGKLQTRGEKEVPGIMEQFLKDKDQ